MCVFPVEEWSPQYCEHLLRRSDSSRRPAEGSVEDERGAVFQIQNERPRPVTVLSRHCVCARRLLHPYQPAAIH